MPMIESIENSLNTLVGLVWSWPVVILCLGAGFVITVVTGGIQFRAFGHAIEIVRGKFDKSGEEGEISHLQALSAAVSATVGLGNIAGVAVAVKTGGAGAVFWMWMIGLVGMATKFAECGLGTLYRVQDDEGNYRGGAMYYITKGIPERYPGLAGMAGPLAMFFAFACAMASLGGGNMFQSNNVATLLKESFDIPQVVTGVVLAGAVAAVILGGIKRIGQVAGVLVPVMCGGYILGALAICLMNIGGVGPALALIFSDAFSGQAAAGGAIGVVIITGVRRAVFSSEAGLGSAPIAHAAARTDEPLRQGIVALLEPFIDTIVVCTATALVIVMADMGGANFAAELDGAALTARAFDFFLPGFGDSFLAIAVCLFAFSTAISWSYYGETSVQYMFGTKAVVPFKMLFVAAFFIGAIWKLGPVLAFSDLTLGLMVVPNLFAVLLLTGKLKEETNSYFGKLRSGAFDGAAAAAQAPAAAAEAPAAAAEAPASDEAGNNE